jgi:hypothetical protein
MILAILYLGWAAADCFRWVSAPALVAAPWAGWANPLAWAVMAFSAIVPGYLAVRLALFHHVILRNQSAS